MDSAEDRQPEPGSGAARKHCPGGSIALVDDEFAGSSGVVCGQQIPATGAQKPLRLAQRLDVRVHALDVFDVHSGQAEKRQAHRHADLARDGQLVLEQKVERLANGPEAGALDGHDASQGVAVANGLEDGPKRRHGSRQRLGEPRQHGILRERPRLARVGDQ